MRIFSKKQTKNASQVTTAYHCMDTQEVFSELSVTADHGLSTEEAEQRLAVYGHNEMKGGGRPSVLKILFRQLANIMTLILLAAIIVSAVTMDWVELGKFSLNKMNSMVDTGHKLTYMLASK